SDLEPPGGAGRAGAAESADEPLGPIPEGRYEAFDDPNGPGAEAQAESVVHDLRAEVEGFELPPYLAENAQRISAKDLLASADRKSETMSAAVIGPDGRIYMLPEDHHAFWNAEPEASAAFAEITIFKDEFAVRPPQGEPTPRQLRAVAELSARGKREGVHVTTGGVD